MTPEQKLFIEMARIRRVEEEIARRYPEQEMRCPVHLSIGQEASPVAIAHLLTRDDTMVSTHRGHAHYLAKGGSLKGLLGELYGKQVGCAKGQGGSMHLIDLEAGFTGSTSIVGGTIPVGVGVAFANQLQGKNAITVVCIGDTTVEEGVFHESMNFAALHKLPVVFLCENNYYSCFSPIQNRQPSRPLVDVAKAHGMLSRSLDGNDVYGMVREIKPLVAGVRAGEGPLFLELLTYRWLEHCGHANDDHLKYRPDEEIAKWRARDPLVLAREHLKTQDLWTESFEKSAFAEIDREVADAFTFAKAAPFPDKKELGAYLYAPRVETPSAPKKSSRQITFTEALREATDQLLETDSSVYLMGAGVPDPKTIFGTTKGLYEKYGPKRVFDMPISENGMTGVGIGAAISGKKPIMVHQRIDFTLYAMDQIVNNAAKWFSMYGGQKSVPMVIRMIIGRGWGQGNQHSQNLQSLYAHVPGLKVVMPSTAYAAKGMLIAAVRDPNPVIFIEHRWLHNTTSIVPEELYEVPLGKARVAREGTDLTIATWSYPTLEVLKAAELLAQQGVSAEVIDLQTIAPMDFETIKTSVRKTGRLLVVDESWRHGGMAAEIIANIVEDSSLDLKTRPQRLTNPHFPSPSTHGLTRYYYTTVSKIFSKVGEILGKTLTDEAVVAYEKARVPDVPDQSFKGPF